jgi:hypothetical protein
VLFLERLAPLAGEAWQGRLLRPTTQNKRAEDAQSDEGFCYKAFAVVLRICGHIQGRYQPSVALKSRQYLQK